MTSLVGHLINGKIVTDADKTQDVFNPSSGEVSKQVALANRATVNEAIASAEKAFVSWRNTPAMKLSLIHI